MSQEKVFVRFAPSPTGWLHVGNVRTALINWLFARAHGGRFLLRIDDTDLARSKAEYEEGLKTDLRWLGLEWDDLKKQSDRFEHYSAAKQKLIDAGRLYPCYETTEEIEVKRKMLAGRGLPPIYDRAALADTPQMRAEYEAQGRKPHWRFKLDHAPIVWDDMVRGRTEFDGAKLSDPVLIREDGGVLFTFATSVDDGEMGITHIIRGEDHVSNSAIQIQIMEALGFAAPIMGHMALLKMKEGKISKREGGGDIKSLREEGILPLALTSYLAKIGTSDAIDLAPSLQQLGAEFAISKLGRAMANYDPAELERLNQKLLRSMTYLEAKKFSDSLTENVWSVIRPNVAKVDDIRSWEHLIHSQNVAYVTNNHDEKVYLQVAAEILKELPWDDTIWERFTHQLKEKTGRKGKELFMPLRRALTADQQGPELKDLIMLLGKEAVHSLLVKASQ